MTANHRALVAEVSRLNAILIDQGTTIAHLRASLADIHNSITVVGTPYDQAMKALDEIVSDVRKRARSALKSPAN
jgi:hypothetical protein